MSLVNMSIYQLHILTYKLYNALYTNIIFS